MQYIINDSFKNELNASVLNIEALAEEIVTKCQECGEPYVLERNGDIEKLTYSAEISPRDTVTGNPSFCDVEITYEVEYDDDGEFVESKMLSVELS